MKRMKCRHMARLADGLPNVYVQVGPVVGFESGFAGCVMCLDDGIAFLEQGIEAARASMAAMLEGIACGHDPEGGLYARNVQAALAKLEAE